MNQPDCYFGVEGDDIFQGGNISTLKNNIDIFVSEQMGNFIALRAYLVVNKGGNHLTGELSEFIKQMRQAKKRKIGRDDPALELFKYMADKGLWSMSLYSSFTEDGAKYLLNELKNSFLFPSYGEMGGGAGELEEDVGFETLDTICIEKLTKAAAKQRALGFKDIGHVDPPLFHSRGLRAGINIPISESMCGYLQLQMVSIRGDARGLGDGRFGSWPAIGYFGGANADPLKSLRLRVALLSSFIAGAKYIISESGHFGTHEFGNKFPAPNLVCGNIRREISRVYSFVKKRKRGPGPETPFAFVKGRFDGWSGCMGRTVYHQENRGGQWMLSSAEKTWDTLSVVLKGYSGCDSYPLQDSDTSWFLGMPYGQFDIIPAESKQKSFSRYGTMIYMGWNTMDKRLYGKMKKYVQDGGMLLMAVPHLSTDTSRPSNVCSSPDMKLYKNGDVRDLFGLKINGMGSYHQRINHVDFCKDFYSIPEKRRYLMETALHPAICKIDKAEVVAVTHQGLPFLTKHKVGKGTACLLHTWDYPGLNAYRILMQNLVEALIKTRHFKYFVDGSDSVEMAVYKKGSLDIIYLLNCDLTKSADIDLVIDQTNQIPVNIPPASIRTVYRCGDVSVLLDIEETFIDSAENSKSKTVFSVNGQHPVEGWVFVHSGKELKSLNFNSEQINQTCFGFRQSRFSFKAKSGRLGFSI